LCLLCPLIRYRLLILSILLRQSVRYRLSIRSIRSALYRQSALSVL
jgi:hypothetical protein